MARDCVAVRPNGVWTAKTGSISSCPTCYGGDGHNPVPFFPPGTVLGPNPDWWSAVLFKRLVGRRVLAVTVAPAPAVSAAANNAVPVDSDSDSEVRSLNVAVLRPPLPSPPHAGVGA